MRRRQSAAAWRRLSSEWLVDRLECGVPHPCVSRSEDCLRAVQRKRTLPSLFRNHRRRGVRELSTVCRALLPFSLSLLSHSLRSVVWNDTALSFYVDGEVYETKTAAEVILPSSPQYMILNAAVAWYFMPGPDAAYPCETCVATAARLCCVGVHVCPPGGGTILLFDTHIARPPHFSLLRTVPSTTFVSTALKPSRVDILVVLR